VLAPLHSIALGHRSEGASRGRARVAGAGPSESRWPWS